MKIELLIQKFKLGTITNDEMFVLLEYLKTLEPRHDLDNHYEKLWAKSEDSVPEIDSTSLYRRIAARIGIEHDNHVHKGKLRLISITDYLKPVFRYAAVFFIAMGLFWFFQKYFSDQKDFPAFTDKITEVEVPFGSKSRITLPDSSVVILNSGSSIKYSYQDFNSENRSVFLTGEGFFNVTKDSLKPFYVKTRGMRIKVLGTIFNIKAYADENTEEATLISGEVELFTFNDDGEKGRPIILKPNQKAVFIKATNSFSTREPVIESPGINAKIVSSGPQPSAEIEQIISWKDDRLIFDNEAFQDLIIRIERWYNVKIFVEYEELYSARFSGKFDNENIEQVLTALASVTPFRYTVKQNTISITKN